MIDLKDLRRRITGAANDQGVYGPTWINPREAVELLNMLETANLDASRYQWLKSRNFPEVFPASPTTSKGWVVTSVDRDWEEQLGDGNTPDEAIDAAMAATKGEQA